MLPLAERRCSASRVLLQNHISFYLTNCAPAEICDKFEFYLSQYYVQLLQLTSSPTNVTFYLTPRCSLLSKMKGCKSVPLAPEASI